VLAPENSRPSKILVYFNIQVTPFVENPTPPKYVGLHEIEKVHLQTAWGQLQMLFHPDSIVEFFFDTLKGAIRLVRVFNNERSLKLILELSDEF